MSGLVEAIYTAPAPGAPMAPLASAVLEAGRGIVGDRYHAGIGTFSAKLQGKPDVEVTLIEVEEIERFKLAESLSLGAGELRRNIVTRGVRLNELVGRTFTVGAAVLTGIRLCEPCAHLAEVVTPQVLPALAHRAGLRARVVSGACIRPGDRVGVQPAATT